MFMKSLLIVMTAFVIGIVSTLAFISFMPQEARSQTTTVYSAADVEESEDSNFVTRILSAGNEEQASPYDRIGEENIRVDKDKVIINVQNAEWSRFTDTNSMDPVIDSGANAIQIVPRVEADIHVGDIVSYKSDYADGTIIHRVVDIGYDDKGWYCLMKGDNNPNTDPGKVRFSQIKRVVVAIIY